MKNRLITTSILEELGFEFNEYLVYKLGPYFTIAHYSDGWAYFNGTHKIGVGIKTQEELEWLVLLMTGKTIKDHATP